MFTHSVEQDIPELGASYTDRRLKSEALQVQFSNKAAENLFGMVFPQRQLNNEEIERLEIPCLKIPSAALSNLE